ncbi:MAG: Lrp/AsnC family transcriptional regulator [Dehalococcoidia bacterium]|nr:Lrp/AsnC family transcriptional regulator [Dehalococcoidia bacterium]
MDELDRRIVAILQADGRASNAKIARAVAVSEGTIRRRLKRLIQQGLITVTAVVEPSKLGFQTEAIIGVQVDPNRLDVAATDLSKFHEVSQVSIATGAYDLFAWVNVRNADELGTFLKTKVGSVTGVRRTETFVILGTPKRGYGVAL